MKGEKSQEGVSILFLTWRMYQEIPAKERHRWMKNKLAWSLIAMPLQPLMEIKVTDLKEDQLITIVLTCI